MAALVEACNVSLSIKNTGHECDTSMGPTAMIIAVPSGLSWDETEIADFDAFINEQQHAAASSRVYPLFGNKAPIRTITNNDEDDVTQTFDDGAQVFIRSGFYNRVFETEKGGLCYAAAMRSFLNAGYAFLEIDKAGKICMKENSDGTFSGFTANMGGRTPKAASFTEMYMNRFGISYDPTTYINQGKIFTGAEAVLDFMGLNETDILEAAPSSTTLLKLGVQTHCGSTDLVALLGNDLAQVTNFIITNSVTGAHPVPTAAAIETAGGVTYVKLTGTYVSGATYIVELNDPSVLFTNGVEGYAQRADGKLSTLIP